MRSASIQSMFFFLFLFSGHFSQTAATDLWQTFHTHAPRPGLQSYAFRSLKSVGCRGGVKMSKNFDIRPTLPPETLTPRRNGSAYQNLELTWCVPMIYVPDSNNCTKSLQRRGSSLTCLVCRWGARLTALPWQC